MRPLGPEDAIVGLAVLVVGLIIALAVMRGIYREDAAEADADRAALDGLIALDPALVAAFGRERHYRDRDGLGYRDRVLDRRKVARLAETHRTRAERRNARDELTEALAALREARA